jgi:hypothetical protein
MPAMSAAPNAEAFLRLDATQFMPSMSAVICIKNESWEMGPVQISLFGA